RRRDARRRRRAVVCDRFRVVLRADPELHRRREHPGLHPDLLRARRRLRRLARNETADGSAMAARRARPPRWTATCRAPGGIAGLPRTEGAGTRAGPGGRTRG